MGNREFQSAFTLASRNLQVWLATTIGEKTDFEVVAAGTVDTRRGIPRAANRPDMPWIVGRNRVIVGRPRKRIRIQGGFFLDGAYGAGRQQEADARLSHAS